MTTPTWQLLRPIDAIVFDCDGTLSVIEGIDELARHNGVGEAVQSLTERAMAQTGINPDLYQARLALVAPKQEQVLALGKQYYAQQVPDVKDVIQLLTRLNKSIYLVSAGLYPAVKIFGELLQIPSAHIFGVEVEFDEQGHYVTYDLASPLVHNGGKRDIVTQLKTRHSHIIHVGDGLNDFVTHDLVTRFIGYGGAFYRKNLAAACQFYIHTLSMAPLLPWTLTQDEYALLNAEEKALYHKGLAAIEAGAVS